MCCNFFAVFWCYKSHFSSSNFNLHSKSIAASICLLHFQQFFPQRYNKFEDLENKNTIIYVLTFSVHSSARKPDQLLHQFNFRRQNRTVIQEEVGPAPPQHLQR
jgi:hypothetical protein